MKIGTVTLDEQVRIAIALFREGRYEEARALFERLVPLCHDLPTPSSYLGCIHRVAGRHADAFTHYNRALAIDPQHWPARHYRTITHLQAGDRTVASRDLADFLDRLTAQTDSPSTPMMVLAAEAGLLLFARESHVPGALVTLASRHPILLSEAIGRFETVVQDGRLDYFFAHFSGTVSIADCLRPLEKLDGRAIGDRIVLALRILDTVQASALEDALGAPETVQQLHGLIDAFDTALTTAELPAIQRTQLYMLMRRLINIATGLDVLPRNTGQLGQIMPGGAVNAWPLHIMDTALTDLPSVVLDGLAFPRFTMDADTQWVAFGSCFADNIAGTINKKNIGRAFSFRIGEIINNTIFNYYILDWIINGPTDDLRKFIDDDIKSFWNISRLEARELLEKARFVVITLGVSRVRWWKGANVPALTLRRTYRPDRASVGEGRGRDTIVLRDIGVEENAQHLDKMISLLNIGEKKNIIVSVSPVPMAAVRDREESAILADCLSKSRLRICAHDIVSTHPHVHYWPSFEIIKWLGAHVPYSTYRDSTHPHDRLIERILSEFHERIRAEGGC